MNLDTFEKIKNKYGDCGSWAIWAQQGDKPKSNIAILFTLEMSLFDWSTNSPTSHGNNKEAILDRNKKNKPNKNVPL